MNKLLNKITLLTAVASGIILVSCQDESQVTTVQPATDTQGISLAPPLMTPNFRLSKFGNEILTYHSDGRIKQAHGTANPAYDGCSTYRIDYEYGNNSIVATKFRDNKKDTKMEWRIENGRAIELTKTGYYTNGSKVTLHAVYHYNNKGQMSKVDLIENEKKTLTLSYDSFGNVVKFLLVRNIKTGDVFENLMTYEYTEYVGSPLEIDKGSTLNLHVFGPKTLKWIGDPYLPIFGNFGKHLLKKSIPTNFAPTYKYAYSLDANGYVKEQKILSKNGELVESKQLLYSIPVKNRL